MKKLLKKFSTGHYSYEIRYADYNERVGKHTLDLGGGRTLKCTGYDGAVWYERKMGTLNWGVKNWDKKLQENIKKKFNIVQVTHNFRHNGFSADYVLRKTAREIAKYMENYLKRVYYKKHKQT